MSCDYHVSKSEAAAVAAGAPDTPTAWSERRGQPQFCPECHRFLRGDGGCTWCEGHAWLKGDAASFHAAITPETIAAMSKEDAGLALGRVFELATGKAWGGINDGDYERLAWLYSKADFTELDGDTVARAYKDLLTLGSANENRDLTGSLVNNPTAPAAALKLAAEEIAFGGGRQRDALALASNPGFDIDAQRTLAASPNAKHRQAVATSPRAAEAVLNSLAYDRDDKVALAALRNRNSPHRPAADKAAAAGISDAETLRTIQRKGHSWRDLPRCGACGAWTKRDGVCGNRRCGGFGRTMASGPKQAGLGVDIPAPVLRRLQDNSRSRAQLASVRQSWAEAREHATFPAEWRKALPGAISELAATGRWDTPDGGALAWDDKAGVYALDGVPVEAGSAGEAVRTYLVWLDTRNQVAITDKDYNPTGEYRPRWRYSEGYDSLVDYEATEPDNAFMQGGKALNATDIPATGTGQAAGAENLAVLATPAGTAVSQAQAEGQALATRAAQLVAGYAGTGLQPTRLEMARLELSGAGQVTAAHSGPLRGAGSLGAAMRGRRAAGQQPALCRVWTWAGARDVDVPLSRTGGQVADCGRSRRRAGASRTNGRTGDSVRRRGGVGGHDAGCDG